MKRTITILLVFLNIFLFNAQTVSTFTDGSPDDAIDLDSDGNIYVSGFDAGKIFKFTPSGTMTEFQTGLSNPNGLAFNSLDELYSCQWTGNVINRYLISGSLDDSFSTSSGNPSGIIKAFESEDMIFAKYTASTLHRITPSGTITTISSAPELNGPVGLAYDDSGALYVGNYNDRTIHRVLPDGSLDYVATVGSSSFLGFITFAHGTLWATVLGEHKIYSINPLTTNDVTVFAGSVQGAIDGALADATFDAPNGIKINDAGDTMYVSEYGSKNLRVISGLNLSVQDINTTPRLDIITNAQQNYMHLSGSVFESGLYKIAVYNLLGQKIIELEKQVHGSNYTINIDTSSLIEGAYIVKVESNKGHITKKVLIKH